MVRVQITQRICIVIPAQEMERVIVEMHCTATAVEIMENAIASKVNSAHVIGIMEDVMDQVRYSRILYL
jgi:hypothetical protein